MDGTAAQAPTGVAIDGVNVAQAATLADEQSATGDAWFYDPSSGALYLNDLQQGPTSTVTVSFGTVDLPPTQPTNLTATAAGTTVNLAWTGATDTDATPVAGYRIYRNGTLISSVSGAATTSYADLNVAVGSYNYTVSGYDTASPANEGAQSAPAAVTVTTSAPLALINDQAGAMASGTSFSIPLRPASVSGDTLVAAIAVKAGSSNYIKTGGVTDSAGGTWIKAAVSYLSGTNSRIELWYRLAAPSLTSVTITLNSSGTATADISEWSGVIGAAAVDAAVAGSLASTTTPSTPTVVTTNATDVVIGAINYPATATATLNGSTFKSLRFGTSTVVHGNAAYAITTAAGSYQAAWSLSALSGGSGGVILALKGTASAPPADTTPPTTTIACNGSSCAGTYSSPVTVSLTATDSGGSGVEATYYTLDGTDPITSGTRITYSSPFSLAAPGATVRYASSDNAGNPEAPHNVTITVTSGGGGTGIFSDGFESGNLSSWTKTTTLAAESTLVDTGTYAARATTTSAAAYASKTLDDHLPGARLPDPLQHPEPGGEHHLPRAPAHGNKRCALRRRPLDHGRALLPQRIAERHHRIDDPVQQHEAESRNVAHPRRAPQRQRNRQPR